MEGLKDICGVLILKGYLAKDNEDDGLKGFFYFFWLYEDSFWKIVFGRNF